MKKLIFILVISIISGLSAQSTQDSTAVKDMQNIRNILFQQKQIIDSISQILNDYSCTQGVLESEIKSLVFEHNNQDSILVWQRQKIIGLIEKQNDQNESIIRQNQLIAELRDDNNYLSQSIDSLNQQVLSNNQRTISNFEEIGRKIMVTGQNANAQFTEVDSRVKNNRLYWIIASLATLLVGGFLYWLINKRIVTNKIDIETQIRNTKTSLEEESVKLDSKLMEVLESQLKLKDINQSQNSGNEEKDHSLVLKVADEVTRILMNLEAMDKNIKGYKHLKKYSSSILDNLKAYGYEIPQLIGQNYKTGMNMVATMEFDDSIEEGKQMIKRIIKPQINYNGKMIQAAKVIVAFNE